MQTASGDEVASEGIETMGLLDRLLRRTPADHGRRQQHHAPRPWDGGVNIRSAAAPPRAAATEEERAVARYRYLLRTAPPEQLEALHAQVFAGLGPEQREQLLAALSVAAPVEAGTSTEPAELARAATAAELRRPGTLPKAFSRGWPAGGAAVASGPFASSMLGTVAAVAVASPLARPLLAGYEHSQEAEDVGDAGGAGPGHTR